MKISAAATPMRKARTRCMVSLFYATIDAMVNTEFALTLEQIVQLEQADDFQQLARQITGWTQPGTIKMTGRGWGDLYLTLVPE
jgi:hypothetical protein